MSLRGAPTSTFQRQGGYQSPMYGQAPVTPASPANIQEDLPLIAKPMTAEEITKHTKVNRGLVIGVIVLLLLVTGLAIWGMVWATQAREPYIGEDSLVNGAEAATVEILVTEGASIGVCSGVFIGKTGQVLTAVHCFQSPSVCDFDPVAKEYPLINGDYLVEVMGINGTKDKYTFSAQVLAWSGITDVMLLQLQPFTKAGTTTPINVVNQQYFRFGDSEEVQRGQHLMSLSFDYGFLKKLAHKGEAQAVHKDRGSDFAVSTEQVFFDGNVEPGASGSGVFNAAGNLVIAPITYGWQAAGAGSNVFAVSGTSSRVSSQIVNRALNPNTPPNGVNNKYLVPSLGIIPIGAVGATFLYNYGGGNTDYFPYTQNRGVAFLFLASQTYYDYLTSNVTSCGFPAYNVTPPSLLDAPLVKTRYGTPPSTFPDFPASGSVDNMIILTAINTGGDDWTYIGEDAGLETISGLIIGGGKWVGDVIKVRIKSINPYTPTDPLVNWEGDYAVTLQAVDPFWDTVYSDPFINYASHIFVDQSNSRLYMDPAISVPRSLKKIISPARELAVSDSRKPARVPAGPLHANNFQDSNDAEMVYSLPTLAEGYVHFLCRQDSRFNQRNEAALRRIDAFRRSHPKPVRPPHGSVYYSKGGAKKSYMKTLASRIANRAALYKKMEESGFGHKNGKAAAAVRHENPNYRKNQIRD